MPALVDEIGATLGFTLEDLALNRAGKLSPHQAADRVKDTIGFVGLMLVLFGLALVVTFSGKLGLGRIILSILSWGLLVVSLVLGGKETAGSSSGKVEMAEGELEFQTSSVYRGQSLVVGRYRMPLDRRSRAPNVLVPGGHYRAFYMADSKKLLSIEPLSPSPVPAAAGENP